MFKTFRNIRVFSLVYGICIFVEEFNAIKKTEGNISLSTQVRIIPIYLRIPVQNVDPNKRISSQFDSEPQTIKNSVRQCSNIWLSGVGNRKNNSAVVISDDTESKTKTLEIFLTAHCFLNGILTDS